ncbi:MAG: hypothetical protein KAT43_02190 [Nanoarchaeota archaeon]|nr:hypothetical protein [Nanoarchaeota archaeon]
MASDWLENLRNVSTIIFPEALDRKQMEDMLIYLARHLKCQVDYHVNLGRVVDNFEGDAGTPKPLTSSVTIDGFFTMDEDADQVIDFKCEKYVDDRTKQKSMEISMDEEDIADYTEDTFETWMEINTLTATYLSRGYHKT